MTIKKDLLKAVSKQVKALSNTIEKMIKEADKAEKAAKKKAPKKAVKKTVKKKTASKKKTVAKKTPAKKAATGTTAFDKVIGIIKKSKKGVDTATLIKRTGFDAKKVANIIYKARKRKLIKSSAKGVYVKA